MSEDIIRISSISQLHQTLGFPKPKHPLISVFDAARLNVPAEYVGSRIISDFYTISMKDKSCGLEYGRNHFDFEEGVMVFTAPKQVAQITEPIQQGDIQGWMLYFHSDLIQGTHLGAAIDEYGFFNYEVFEALHLSDEEERTINDCVANIKKEYEQRIDNHSQRVIVSNLELLLNYCLRFYERQFNTRTSQNRDIVSRFQQELKQYFAAGQAGTDGIPPISYFAEKFFLSPHYFSDLLKKESGRSAKDHINDFVIEKAKHVLLSSNQAISEIAYDLGFNYPHYFTRLFKSKTGLTPVEYRNLN
ncbi:helix-turn-helix domain-containing protein [Flavilitoribacter nigricans]|uniref:AraC family transcriptional regulator n=1 Tax=Flavilitoribacter nigricans (strain ATCC 23147 / DSM 23189 / NBRC 102662 / NCIMB 1420 / SS-2) TaxID=1122177 RepID=A0A2D0NC84_FLAN2|nr:helix-turn-helix transcriptional regulator [Flavilitoribacter nigricans]PHN06095.1 AraC family transcriptional regulator [Flavilitoribacter nigricans DSM 23189 = NBRC 102662]